ncbi:MAG: hypothetical protein IPM98_10355 [Lewinellaceae bacterium]|nr:hypothetical protein [Lewinellaceae bacterium]
MDRNTWIGLVAAALCLAFVFLTANGGKNTEVETLLDATMAVHDEAMVEMADMNRIGRTLKKNLVGLDSLSPRADSIRVILRQIKKAEEDMYAWMRNYEPPTELPADEAKRYLEDQKEKISRNQEDIRAARDAARKVNM